MSGSSQLTYHIGCMPDGEIYLRVHGNTGGGFFSQEWISLRDIHRALEKRPEGKPITSILLKKLSLEQYQIEFKGLSIALVSALILAKVIP